MVSRLRELVLIPNPTFYEHVSEWVTQNIAGQNLPYMTYRDDTDLKELTKLYDRFICVYKIPDEWMKDKTSTVRIVYVNSEQLTDPEMHSNYSQHVAYPGVEEIWDYSEANIAISQKGKLLKCVPSKQELSILRTLLAITPKTHDVAAISLWYPKRQAIANELRRRGWSVLEIESFGQARDTNIARAHVLLNWHGLEVRRVYEELRCERWRLAGMPVVTESCVNTHLPKHNLYVVPTDDVNGIESVLCELLHKKCR